MSSAVSKHGRMPMRRQFSVQTFVAAGASAPTLWKYRSDQEMSLRLSFIAAQSAAISGKIEFVSKSVICKATNKFTQYRYC